MVSDILWVEFWRKLEDFEELFGWELIENGLQTESALLTTISRVFPQIKTLSSMGHFVTFQSHKLIYLNVGLPSK